MKKFIFVWQDTDNYTYWCESITPFECEDLDEFILKSVQKVKDSEIGTQILGKYINVDEAENLFHSFYELDKWFEINKIILNKNLQD